MENSWKENLIKHEIWPMTAFFYCLIKTGLYPLEVRSLQLVYVNAIVIWHFRSISSCIFDWKWYIGHKQINYWTVYCAIETGCVLTHISLGIYNIIPMKSNLYYTCGIPPKRVTGGGAHFRSLAPGQDSCEKKSQQWRAVDDTVQIWPAQESNPRPTAPTACA